MLALVAGLSASVAAIAADDPQAAVTLNVVDVTGDPVAGADVIAGLLKHHAADSIFRGRTDENGRFHFSGEHQRGFSTRITKRGFYETEIRDALHGAQPLEGENMVSVVRQVVLRPIRSPIAMFARGERLLVVPQAGARTGYDLEAGDWVEPHGRGRTADLFFTLTGTWESPAEFDSTLAITFPNEGDGIVAFDAEWQQGSTFLSPYEAPLEGYKPRLQWRFARIPRPDNGADPVEAINTTRPDQHFILRVRTVLDEDGNVERAQYAKIYGPLEFDGVRPGVSHIRFQAHYLNPGPNDPNLEFAVGETLIDKLPREAGTALP